jgi:hypothetical protein
MTQFCHGARFAQEAISDITVTGELSLDNFDCDGPVETEVSGEIDRTHSTGPDLAFDPKPASDELGDIHGDLPSG